MLANDLHSSIIALHIAVGKRVSPLQDDVYTDKQRRDGEPETVSGLMKYNAIFLGAPFLFLPTLVIVLCWRHQTSGSSVYTSHPPIHAHLHFSSFLFYRLRTHKNWGNVFRKAKFNLSHHRTNEYVL